MSGTNQEDNRMRLKSKNDIQMLIKELTCGEDLRCQIAREKLEGMGATAMPDLIAALGTAKGQARWELVKTLADIADPSAVQPLTNLLDDADHDIRWLAADGLSAIGYDSLKPVLRSLVSHGKSLFLLRTAHYVLRNIAAKGYISQLRPVLLAFDGPEAELTVPVAAEQLLVKL